MPWKESEDEKKEARKAHNCRYYEKKLKDAGKEPKAKKSEDEKKVLHREQNRQYHEKGRLPCAREGGAKCSF
jgi:hypothetical protein